MRKYYPVAALLILLAAIALMASIATTNANATPGFTVCGACHTQAAAHAQHVPAVACATCHTVGAAAPPPPSACASCHGAAAIVAKHPAGGCSIAGCHAAAPVVTSVSLKVAPTSIKLKKTVKATGSVTPAADLAGMRVLLRAEIRVGKAWRAARVGSATVSDAGLYVWTYKPAKKGIYRMTATIKATADYKGSKSPTRAFRVK